MTGRPGAGANLGLALWRMGDFQPAIEHIDLAHPDLTAVGDIYGQAAYHFYRSLVLETQGQIASALFSYTEAKKLYEEMGGIGFSYDARAGMARCFYKMGELDQAREQAVAVWEYLSKHGPSSMEFPIMAYQTCADIFTGLGDSQLTLVILEAAYREVIERAAKISNPEWKESFLVNIPENRAIIAQYSTRPPQSSHAGACGCEREFAHQDSMRSRGGR